MGRLRVDTITKLIVSPERKPEIMLEYQASKVAQLSAKHPQANPKDIFEKSSQSGKMVTGQVLIAQNFLAQDAATGLLHRTAKSAAIASEDLLFVMDRDRTLREARSTKQRIEVYSDLITLLAAQPEPVIGKAIRDTLLHIQESTAPRLLREELYKPLAVAIGMRYDGIPTQNEHHIQVAAFLISHFKSKAPGLTEGVMKELSWSRRKTTARLLLEMRVQNSLQ
jgi:hypothetical protein